MQLNVLTYTMQSITNNFLIAKFLFTKIEKNKIQPFYRGALIIYLIAIHYN